MLYLTPLRIHLKDIRVNQCIFVSFYMTLSQKLARAEGQHDWCLTIRWFETHQATQTEYKLH